MTPSGIRASALWADGVRRMPGIIVMTATFGTVITALGLTEDMKAGVVDRFRSLPMARSAVLIRRTLADLAMNAVAVAVMLLVFVPLSVRAFREG
jgi:ABC-2 type transport system permease protein/oleandomycin transport system permease protein